MDTNTTSEIRQTTTSENELTVSGRDPSDGSGELHPRRAMCTLCLRNGETAVVRLIRRDDEPRMVAFHEGLSDHTVYLRYFKNMKLSARTDHRRLSRVCCPDRSREEVLVATTEVDAHERIVGVARLSRLQQPDCAEFAVLVHDAYQRQGLGKALLACLVTLARERGYRHIVGNVLPENHGMRRLLAQQSVPVRYRIEDGILVATLELAAQ